MSIDDKYAKEGILYRKLSNDSVICDLCAFRCKIPNNGLGLCQVRQNHNGKLYSLVYGKPCAIAVDEIERRPFFHFEPGSSILTLATEGCNFKCNFCINHEISQKTGLTNAFVSPEQIVETAIQKNCNGICFAYTEPTIFLEYVIDIAKIAKTRGLFCSMITNGYLTLESIEKISGLIDAVLVNLKMSGNAEQMRNLAMVPTTVPIFECMKEIKRKNTHLELSDLIMPNHNYDSFQQLCAWISANLGKETPLHLLQFHPEFKMVDNSPTDLAKIERMKEYAQNFLDYVYVSNVPNTEMANTVCPNCKNVVVRRLCFTTIDQKLEGSKCMFCKTKIIIKYAERKNEE